MDIQQPMTLVARGLHVDNDQVAKLFGVDEPTLHRWDQEGVPAEVEGKLDTVLAISVLLNAKLRPESVGRVVVRPADAFYGLNMVQMIQRNKHAELLAELQRSFDWSGLN